jgi:hypothetical protein
MLTKKRPYLIFLSITLVLQLVIACSPASPSLPPQSPSPQSPPTQTPPPQTAQSVQGERWVIFPEAQAKEQGIATWFLNSGQTAEYWTPSEKDVLALEDGLVFYLQNNSNSFYEQGTPVWEKLDDYNRQYIGIILDGKRIVYANFFCNNTGRDWRKEFIFVLDGGECFFQFKYDPDSGEFFDLQVNGVA